MILSEKDLHCIDNIVLVQCTINVSKIEKNIYIKTIATNTFLPIFGLVAFIKQKENDNNNNLSKIHVGLYNAFR